MTEIFNERDPAKRQAAIAQLCAPGMVFVDPEGETRGLDAFGAKVREVLAKGSPTFEFQSAGPAQEVQSLGLHRWQLGPVGESPVVSGTDVVLAERGLIVAFYTVVD